MAFEGLTEKISSAFKHLRSKGRLTESDIKDAMKEIRMALLEADVNFKVAKDFIKTVRQVAVFAGNRRSRKRSAFSHFVRASGFLRDRVIFSLYFCRAGCVSRFDFRICGRSYGCSHHALLRCDAEFPSDSSSSAD